MSTTELEITPYHPSQEAGVVRLWEIVFPDDPPWNAPLDVIRRKSSVQPELFLVGSLVGASHEVGAPVATVLAGFDGVRGWIHHLAVDPELRRRGFATALVHAAERALERAGCPKLNLQVRAGNVGAAAFYESLGFSIEDRISFGKRLAANTPE